MKLYANHLSPNAKRILVLAKEVGARLDIVDVDFHKGEQKSPAYLAVNPNGKLPTFQDDDGWTLWESPAILVHLADKYPSKGLVPTNTRANAEVLRWMFWNASHFESAVFKIAIERFVKPMFRKVPTSQEILAQAVEDIAVYAPILNAQLEGKTWVAGDAFSIADVAIATTVEFSQLEHVGVDLSSCRHIGAWFQRVAARDSWK